MPNFITKIKIKNFFSIKNEIEIDFSADDYTIKNHKDRVFEYNGKFYNKLISFYGANATGKTTILKAIVFISYILSNKTNTILIHHSNIYSKDKHSFISIEFVLENRKFNYFVEFEVDNSLIVGIKNEKLILLDNNIVLLDRKKKILFDFKQKSIADIILFEKVSKSKSLLIEATTRTDDYDSLVNFFENIVLLSNIKGVYNVAMQLEHDENFLLASLFDESESFLINEKIRSIDKIGFYRFLIKALKQIRLDIKDVKSKIEIKKISSNQNDINIRFFTIHNIDSNKKLPFNLESHGTQMIFRLLFDLYFAYKNKTILVIDELDSILHPMLVPYFLLIAIKNDIQFIYSTHNIYNLKFLYKDEMFFIEKDCEHNTKVITPKNNKEINGYENLLTLYEENVLGGIPDIKDIDFNID